MVYSPTVRPSENFNAEEDARVLKEAMKGMGTEEGPIVDILAKRCFKQREEITQAYKREFGRDLAEDLQKELGGDLEDLMMGLTYSYFEYLSHELKKAFKGFGTKEKVVNEILLSRNNSELHLLQEVYAKTCHSSLEEDIREDMKGDLEKLLVALLSGSRNEVSDADSDKAKVQAQDLYNAGEQKLGTNEAVFRQLFSHESLPQLLAIAEEYENISKKTLKEAIESELGGGFQQALLIILEVAKDKIQFYSDILYNSMQGAGTDDKTLIRIVLSRSELDLGDIKAKYLNTYGKTLDHSIERETSGPYKEALVQLVRG
ncbi:annexin A8-like [Pollicipes pollicipes]|uniref:annexin A8-like n=1 Tax=Pollicipes pollicipes TaxID=41117 RepID=UPI001884F8B1|nr:annexin A8-like [Pollicipes pollicipes]XP_037094057.1 annexin A8-like [Pollicipes pollicipes]